MNTFVRAARRVGMSEEEISSLEDYLSSHPTAGDEIVGTGGCRKLRWPGRGKGKGGGYRAITFFSGKSLPVFLITVFGKGEKASLTHDECNSLRKMTKVLLSEYGTTISKVGVR